MSALRRFLKEPKPDKRVATIAVMHGPFLLMGKRTDNQKWTTPGGHADQGEDFLEAAVRELKEESGIVAKPSQLKAVGEPNIVENDKGQTVEVQPYQLRLTRRPPLSSAGDPDNEVKRWQWVDTSEGIPDKIRGNLHVPEDRNVLMSRLFAGDGDPMKDMPNLKKFMKKNRMEGDDPMTDPTNPKVVKPAPAWESTEMAGNESVSTNDFETEDTEDDPIVDKTGPDSKKAMSNLEKFEKLNKK